MDLFLPGFWLAWVTLMGGPAVAVAVAIASLKPEAGRGPAVAMALRAAALLAIVVSFWFLRLQFDWPPSNWLALAAAYWAWCVLIGVAPKIRPRWLGLTTASLAGVSLVPGMLLGTVGVLGLMFIVGDFTGPPLENRNMAPGVDCVVTGWGNVTSDDGHDVHIYRYLPWFPLLRREVRHIVVNETHPDPTKPIATCAGETRAALIG